MVEPIVIESFADRINRFNEKATKHMESQSLNPFSGSFAGGSRSPSPRPTFSKDEYGRPEPGSKTEQRGRKAHSHICREILELCAIIYDMGHYQSKHQETEENNTNEESPVIVRFGDLFQMYTKISDKVVGLLLAAKKRGLVYFEREILFQRRDDDVLIALMKPMDEIRKILQKEIASSTTIVPPNKESDDASSTN